jgi:hypothetical protein
MPSLLRQLIAVALAWAIAGALPGLCAATLATDAAYSAASEQLCKPEGAATPLVVESVAQALEETDDGIDDVVVVGRHAGGDDLAVRLPVGWDHAAGSRQPIVEVFHPPERARAESSPRRPA